MSTRDRNAGGPADDLPRDPLLARVYRGQADAAGGPPPALDARILAAARAAATEPRRPARPALPWWRRLLVPVSVTAVMVVSATLTLMVHEEQEKAAAQRAAPAPAAAPAVVPAPASSSAPAPSGPVPHQPMPAENAQAVREPAPKRATSGESAAGDADLAAHGAAVAGAVRRDAAAEPAAPAAPPQPQGGVADQAPDAARTGAGRAPAPATAGAPVGAAAAPSAPAAPAAPMAPAPLPFPASRASAPAGGAAGEVVERRSASPGAPAADAAAAAPLARPQAGPQAGPQGEPAQGARFKSRANVAGEAERSEKAAVPLQESRQESRDEALRTPEAWLKEIRELRRAGRETEWRAALARFRERYPDYEIPADLRN